MREEPRLGIAAARTLSLLGRAWRSPLFLLPRTPRLRTAASVRAVGQVSLKERRLTQACLLRIRIQGVGSCSRYMQLFGKP